MNIMLSRILTYLNGTLFMDYRYQFCRFVVFNYEYLEDCSGEAFEVYVELNGESECIGKDENGNWISYDCDTCPNRDNC